MFRINNQEVTHEEVERLYGYYAGLEHFKAVEGQRIALCIEDPAFLVTLILFLKSRGCSTLLIHGETPLKTAYVMAMKADCSALIYHDPKNYRSIGREQWKAESAPAVYQYSSGTTGDPKLISRTWEEIEEEIEGYNQALALPGEEEPIILVPVSHSYGLISGVLSSMARGTVPTIITHKNPKYTLKILQEHPHHIVYGVPALFHVLSSFPQQELQFNHLMSSGAPMSEALFAKLSQMTGTMKQQYGCSEAGCISLSNKMKSNVDIGVALGHFSVLSETKEGEPSELVVRTGTTDIHTKDLVYISSEQELTYVSRMDDVINVSGLKVFPLEVEETIQKLSGIKEVVVYRGQHPLIGEVVKAKVVAEEELTADNIRDWCIQHLPPYKVPAEVECVLEIPKNKNGKISRKLLEIGDVQ